MTSHIDGLRVFVSWSDYVPDTGPTWVDITAWVEMSHPVTVTRGRQDEVSTVQPGTLTLTLDNTDGRFTPGHAGSPYFPAVTLQRPIKVTWTDGATTWTRFTGFVDSWEVIWPTGGDERALVRVKASDVLRRIGSRVPLRGNVENEILAFRPVAYWTFADAEGSTSAVDSAGRGAPALTARLNGWAGVGEYSFGSGVGAVGDGLTALMLTPAADPDGLMSGWRLACGGLSFAGWTTFGLHVFCRASSAVVVADGGSWTLAFTSASTVEFTSGLSATVTATVAAGVAHDIIVIGGSGTVRLWVDGVLAATQTLTGSLGTVLAGVSVGAAGTARPTGPLTISHLAIFSELDAAAVPLLWGAVSSSAPECSGARVARIARWVGVPASTDTGMSLVASVDPSGSSALDALGKVAATEQGVVFADREGRLVLHSRSRRYNAAVAASFDAADVGGGMSVVLDDSRLVTEAVVSAPGGIRESWRDDALTAAFGVSSVSVDSLCVSESAAQGLAQWLCLLGGSLIPRVPDLVFDLVAAPGIRASVLGLEISSRIAVTGLPSQAPPLSLFVEGFMETMTFGAWDVSVSTSPASPWDGFWTLGTSTLDSTTRLAY